jgi:hypothetical protein
MARRLAANGSRQGCLGEVADRGRRMIRPHVNTIPATRDDKRTAITDRSTFSFS